METINLEPVLSFLKGLAANNNKPWFEQHRPDYEAARTSFEHFTDTLLEEFRVSDNLGDLTAKDCVSRIYRDVRFSKDKSPYKTHLWATIAPGGKKMVRMGYHFGLEPGGRSMIATGLWEPMPEQLARFRQAIDQNAAEFKKIINNPAFIDHFGGIEGEKLKTAPQGYDKTHPELDLLRYKQILVAHHFSDDQVLSSNFFSQVVSGCQAMRPFINYFDRILT